MLFEPGDLKLFAGGLVALTVRTTHVKNNTLLRFAASFLPVLCLLTCGGNFAHGQGLPFIVRFWYPTNGQTFLALANIGIHAQVLDSNLVETVQYFSGATSLGIVTNIKSLWLTNTSSYNPFFLLWSNVPAGNYTLTAVATDSAGIMATSPPVNIYVVTSLPPVVRIYAPDPVAIEGTNFNNWFIPGTPSNRYAGVTNTATFLVWRDGATNADLTVEYAITGTATNGADFATIPDSVTIAAGRRYAPITIIPLNDKDSAYRHYDTVVLTLTLPGLTPAPYKLGWPWKAGAIILEENILPLLRPMIRGLSDNSIHVSLPATNGMNVCVQTSTDLINWLPICTNTVLKGSAQFVDPNDDAGASPNRFYRIVPVTTPPAYGNPRPSAPASTTSLIE